MYKELRFDEQILEELLDAKFLCASCHVKFINCCRDMTPAAVFTKKLSTKFELKPYSQRVKF